MNKQSGFSLLEILIAFSILALSLSIMLKIFSGGLNTAGVAEDYNVAVQIAETLMAKTGVETPLQNGESTGQEHDKYHWRVLVTPFEFTAKNFDATTLGVVLYKVRVTVNWGDELPRHRADPDVDGRQVELTTLKLVNKEL